MLGTIPTLPKEYRSFRTNLIVLMRGIPRIVYDPLYRRVGGTWTGSLLENCQRIATSGNSLVQVEKTFAPARGPHKGSFFGAISVSPLGASGGNGYLSSLL